MVAMPSFEDSGLQACCRGQRFERGLAIARSQRRVALPRQQSPPLAANVRKVYLRRPVTDQVGASWRPTASGATRYPLCALPPTTLCTAVLAACTGHCADRHHRTGGGHNDPGRRAPGAGSAELPGAAGRPRDGRGAGGCSAAELLALVTGHERNPAHPAIQVRTNLSQVRNVSASVDRLWHEAAPTLRITNSAHISVAKVGTTCHAE
jgi:hypothetical protein